MSITPEKKAEVVKEFATKEGDTGSPEVQIAILTERINNLTEHFKDNHYLEPVIRSGGPGRGYVDKWVVYGTINGEQLFSACELTIEPGYSTKITDPGASGLIVTQGSGTIGSLDVDCPVYIRFGETTKDEVFITARAAADGVTFTNTGSEPFVCLRYFGPNVHKDLPKVGAYKAS